LITFRRRVVKAIQPAKICVLTPNVGGDYDMDSLRSLGESGIIRIMERALGSSQRDAIGFGDDVSAVRLTNNLLAVFKTDMLVGSTDVPPGMTMRQTARKAVIANVSDFAAKGVRPYAGLVALGLPANMTTKDVQEVARGLSRGAKEYHFPLLGGDTNESKDLVISISLLGLTPRRKLILRSGAKIGDIVAVTGDFGSTSAGLRALIDEKIRPERLPRDLAKAVYHSDAELDVGLKLAATGAITSSIDSSDGLAWSLHEISKMSRIGIILSSVPISKAAQEFAANYGYDAVDLALYGGEEYRLIFTVKRSLLRTAQKAIGGRLRPIGVVTKRAEGVRLSEKGRDMKIEMKGWQHFRS